MLLLRKSDVLKTLIYRFKVCPQISFWEAATHADITNFGMRAKLCVAFLLF